MVERRRRRSAAPAPAGPGLSLAPVPPSAWGVRLAWALLLIGALSALEGLFAMVALAGAIGNLGPPQTPLDFFPVFAGGVLGLVGDALLVSGAGGVLFPGARFTGGRSRALVGLALQLPAAAAVGALESSLGITLLYLAAIAGLWYLARRVLPAPGPRPLARHPLPEPSPAGAGPLPGERRWATPQRVEPIRWVAGGAPPPPSAAIAGAATDDGPVPGRDRSLDRR